MSHLPTTSARTWLLSGLFALWLALSMSFGGGADGATLRVSVVDQEGRPYQLGSLWVHRTSPIDPEFYRQLPIDANGHALIELAPGEYESRWDTADSIRPASVFVNSELLPRYGNLVRVDEHRLEQILADFTVTSEDVTIKFVVPYLEANRLRGLVATRDGLPIENLRFDLYRGDAMNCARCAVTDNSGRFDFVCRKFPIRLVPQDYTGLWMFEPAELIVSTPTTDTLSFDALPKTAQRLRGVAVDRDSGEPISDVWVEYRQECLDAWADGKVKTGSDGAFAASCHPGCGMTIETWHYHHEYQRRTIELGPNSCGELARIELTRK